MQQGERRVPGCHHDLGSEMRLKSGIAGSWKSLRSRLLGHNDGSFTLDDQYFVLQSVLQLVIQ